MENNPSFQGLARRRRGAARSGFTLLELLAVMLILGLLAGFLVFQLGRSGDLAKERLTRTRLAEIAAVIEAYERRFGDFPPSSFTSEQGQPPNALNIGVEALVVALFSRGFEGGGAIFPEDLENVDGDQSLRPLSELGTSELFELVDLWGNPLAYFHSADYGRIDRYLTQDLDTGEWIETEARALVDERTRRHYQVGRFQLISAGMDGRFGTEDDITHFSRR